jgi:hypothetical protein
VSRDGDLLQEPAIWLASRSRRHAGPSAAALASRDPTDTILTGFPKRSALHDTYAEGAQDAPRLPAQLAEEATSAAFAMVSDGLVGAGGVEPPSSSVSDPTSHCRDVRRTVKGGEGSLESDR